MLYLESLFSVDLYVLCFSTCLRPLTYKQLKLWYAFFCSKHSMTYAFKFTDRTNLLSLPQPEILILFLRHVTTETKFRQNDYFKRRYIKGTYRQLGDTHNEINRHIKCLRSKKLVGPRAFSTLM